MLYIPKHIESKFYKTYTQSAFCQHIPCRSLKMVTDFSVHVWAHKHTYICLKLKIMNQKKVEYKKSAMEDSKTIISNWNQVTRHKSYPLWSQRLSFLPQSFSMEIDLAKSQTVFYSTFLLLFKKEYFSYYIMHYTKALEK